jgi:hypothetical protein
MIMPEYLTFDYEDASVEVSAHRRGENGHDKPTITGSVEKRRYKL